jgi:hypothetical protein
VCRCICIQYLDMGESASNSPSSGRAQTSTAVAASEALLVFTVEFVIYCCVVPHLPIR